MKCCEDRLKYAWDGPDGMMMPNQDHNSPGQVDVTPALAGDLEHVHPVLPGPGLGQDLTRRRHAASHGRLRL